MASFRITDIDVGEETAELARNQIEVQASQAVLVQANLQPEILLGLIKGAGIR